MLKDFRIIAFVPTKNTETARIFYEGTVGLQFVSDDPFALVFRSGGTTVRVVRVQEFQPAPFTILGWEVDDIRAAARELGAKGVEFLRYPGMAQDEAGIWSAPGGAKVAWFRDPDGNVLSISQP